MAMFSNFSNDGVWHPGDTVTFYATWTGSGAEWWVGDYECTWGIANGPMDDDTVLGDAAEVFWPYSANLLFYGGGTHLDNAVPGTSPDDTELIEETTSKRVYRITLTIPEDLEPGIYYMKYGTGFQPWSCVNIGGEDWYGNGWCETVVRGSREKRIYYPGETSSEHDSGQAAAIPDREEGYVEKRVMTEIPIGRKSVNHG